MRSSFLRGTVHIACACGSRCSDSTGHYLALALAFAGATRRLCVCLQQLRKVVAAACPCTSSAVVSAGIRVVDKPSLSSVAGERTGGPRPSGQSPCLWRSVCTCQPFPLGQSKVSARRVPTRTASLLQFSPCRFHPQRRVGGSHSSSAAAQSLPAATAAIGYSHSGRSALTLWKWPLPWSLSVEPPPNGSTQWLSCLYVPSAPRAGLNSCVSIRDRTMSDVTCRDSTVKSPQPTVSARPDIDLSISPISLLTAARDVAAHAPRVHRVVALWPARSTRLR